MADSQLGPCHGAPTPQIPQTHGWEQIKGEADFSFQKLAGKKYLQLGRAFSSSMKRSLLFKHTGEELRHRNKGDLDEKREENHAGHIYHKPSSQPFIPAPNARPPAAWETSRSADTHGGPPKKSTHSRWGGVTRCLCRSNCCCCVP